MALQTYSSSLNAAETSGMMNSFARTPAHHSHEHPTTGVFMHSIWIFFFLYVIVVICSRRSEFRPISLRFYSRLLLHFAGCSQPPISLPPHIDCGVDPQCPLHPLLPWVSHGGCQTETEGWKPPDTSSTRVAMDWPRGHLIPDHTGFAWKCKSPINPSDHKLVYSVSGESIGI